MFLSLNFQRILKLVYFETLDKFSTLFLEIHKFNFFNQILLNLFRISDVFHNNI